MENSTRDKTRAKIRSVISRYERDKRIMTTWDLLRVPNFHLNGSLVVIDRDELEFLLAELSGLPNPTEGSDH